MSICPNPKCRSVVSTTDAIIPRSMCNALGERVRTSKGHFAENMNTWQGNGSSRTTRKEMEKIVKELFLSGCKSHSDVTEEAVSAAMRATGAGNVKKRVHVTSILTGKSSRTLSSRNFRLAGRVHKLLQERFEKDTPPGTKQPGFSYFYRICVSLLVSPEEAAKISVEGTLPDSTPEQVALLLARNEIARAAFDSVGIECPALPLPPADASRKRKPSSMERLFMRAE